MLWGTFLHLAIAYIYAYFAMYFKAYFYIGICICCTEYKFLFTKNIFRTWFDIKASQDYSVITS
jgi:hypothetical protein